jgi:hypothetical protein
MSKIPVAGLASCAAAPRLDIESSMIGCAGDLALSRCVR